MTQQDKIQLFEQKQVRTVWDDEEEVWYFSIIDVIEVLTNSPRPRKYWNALKTKLLNEGSELSQNIGQLKMRAADGKMRMTDVADTEHLFRLIQSIPSPKAEPFKLWMAQIASERLDQMQDPELSIEQVMTDYRRLGYSENWINQRVKSIEIRKELTDEWKRCGLEEGVQLKGLKKENLRDNMTNRERVLNMLAELTTKGISENTDPQTMHEHADVAHRGATVARNARIDMELQIGEKVVTSLNAKTIQNMIENKEDKD